MSLSEMLFMTDSEKTPFIKASQEYRKDLKKRIKEEEDENNEKKDETNNR